MDLTDIYYLSVFDPPKLPEISILLELSMSSSMISSVVYLFSITTSILEMGSSI